MTTSAIQKPAIQTNRPTKHLVNVVVADAVGEVVDDLATKPIRHATITKAATQKTRWSHGPHPTMTTKTTKKSKRFDAVAVAVVEAVGEIQVIETAVIADVTPKRETTKTESPKADAAQDVVHVAVAASEAKANPMNRGLSTKTSQLGKRPWICSSTRTSKTTRNRQAAVDGDAAEDEVGGDAETKTTDFVAI